MKMDEKKQNRVYIVLSCLVVMLLIFVVGYYTQFRYTYNGYELHRNDFETSFINKRLPDGTTYLGEAARVGSAQKIRLLVRNKANIDMIDIKGDTPLILAVEHKKLEAVKVLIELGAGINKRDNSGETALHYAASSGQTDIMDVLLRNKADVNSRDVEGETPLFNAVKRNKEECVEVLLNNGASMNIKNSEGKRAISYMKLENVELAGEMLSKISVKEDQADLEKLLFKYLSTHVNNNVLSIIKMIVEKGIQVNIRDQGGQTPLHYAAYEQNIDLMKYLVKKGAKVNSYDNAKDTPLLNAVKSENLEGVRYLLSQGADVDLQNLQGDTPLSAANRSGNAELMNIINGN